MPSGSNGGRPTSPGRTSDASPADGPQSTSASIRSSTSFEPSRGSANASANVMPDIEPTPSPQREGIILPSKLPPTSAEQSMKGREGFRPAPSSSTADPA